MTRYLAIAGLCFAAACTMDSPPPEGLSLDDERADHVSGTFARDGVAFEFDIDRAGVDHTLVIRSMDGDPLVETSLVDGIETNTFLGRLTLTAQLGAAEPDVDGDADAYAEARAMPEMQLVGDFRTALQEHGIDREMYAAPEPAKGERQSWQATVVQCGKHLAIPTYSWWWSVNLYWHNTSYQNWAGFQIVDGLIKYNKSEPPRPGGYYHNQYGPWSWWTIYIQNHCWWGNAPVWVDSTLL